ncbi:hypothetical protein ACFO1B_22020 [Dactylosporangium siamense]|uniref:hypothetical protein n=1 Tax=Dactylosporangium siamense TaxID=685454 RepID=UPI0019445259|nr:hypothetical protein [Dactylosporangium siamense]
MARSTPGRSSGDSTPARISTADTAPSTDWYATAGGGDGLPLALLVLAALDGDPVRLASVAGTARAAGDAEIEVLALDALAHVRAERGDAAGARAALAGRPSPGGPRRAALAAMAAARHLLADGDRVDRDPALSRL